MHENWLSHSRRQSMGLPIKGWYVIKSVFRLAFRRFPYPAVSQIRPKRRLEWSNRGRSIQSSCLLPLVVNTHETIAWFHGSFALLFSRLFSGHASNPERSHQRGLRKWDGIKQRLLI